MFEFVISWISYGQEKESGMKKMTSVVGLLVLTALSGLGQSEAAFFRIIAPTNTKITAFDSQGYLVWTNAATAGVTCTVQRAATMAGPSNWVDYVQHRVTNATMIARVQDPATPSGMAYIPAGSFQMGDTFTEGSTVERPVHTVFVSAFYMDRTEVTWAKWKEVRDWAVNNGYDLSGIGAGKAESHPVQTVSWYDCVKWCNARSQKEGRTPAYYTDAGFTAVYRSGPAAPVVKGSAAGYRLPTEAEWEKAARGGLSGRRFPWGDTIQQSRANYYSYWSGGVPNYPYDLNAISGYHPSFAVGGTPYTSPAGSFAPNGYGLYDMSGNVWEWCWDWYGSAYYGTSPSSNPSGPASGSGRVFRGGGWSYDAGDGRSAYRGNGGPAPRGGDMGFRAVLPPGQQ